MARFVYQCPICDEVYEDEWEAEECIRYCTNDHPIIIKLDVGEFVINGEVVQRESCDSCAHSDCDGHRFPPCPHHHFAPVIMADSCKSYTKADSY